MQAGLGPGRAGPGRMRGSYELEKFENSVKIVCPLKERKIAAVSLKEVKVYRQFGEACTLKTLNNLC